MQICWFLFISVINCFVTLLIFINSKDWVQRHSLHVGGSAHSAKRLIRNERCVKLCQHGICRLNANSDLHRKIGVRTATHLQIPPSSPSHPIIGDLQRIVPAKPLRSNVSVSGRIWSLYRGPFRGIISDRGGAGVPTSGVLVSRSHKLLLIVKISTMTVCEYCSLKDTMWRRSEFVHYRTFSLSLTTTCCAMPT